MNNSNKGEFYFGITDTQIYICFFEEGKNEFVWGTSWGVSTRLIGALIMSHSDDRGLVLPPNLAPNQVIIIPIYNSKEDYKKCLEKAEEINNHLIANNIRSEIEQIRSQIAANEARIAQQNMEHSDDDDGWSDFSSNDSAQLRFNSAFQDGVKHALEFLSESN